MDQQVGILQPPPTRVLMHLLMRGLIIYIIVRALWLFDIIEGANLGLYHCGYLQLRPPWHHHLAKLWPN